MTAASVPNAFQLAQFGDLTTAQLASLAEFAECSERYDNMCAILKALVVAKGKAGETLNAEERTLLSVAYKNAVGGRRASWRGLVGIDADAEKLPGSSELLSGFRAQVVTELTSFCEEIIDLLKTILLPGVEQAGDDPREGTQIFYLKLAADYYRYMCEFAPDKGHEEEAKTFYDKALLLAEDNLEGTDPILLGLSLNFSVFHYEILKNPEAAIQLAKKAFDNAIANLDKLDGGSSYKDSTLIMQLIRDNLSLWSEAQDEEE